MKTCPHSVDTFEGYDTRKLLTNAFNVSVSLIISIVYCQLLYSINPYLLQLLVLFAMAFTGQLKYKFIQRLLTPIMLVPLYSKVSLTSASTVNFRLFDISDYNLYMCSEQKVQQTFFVCCRKKAPCYKMLSVDLFKKP